MKAKVVQFCTFENIYNQKLCDALIKNETFRNEFEITVIILSQERKLFEKNMLCRDYNDLSTLEKFKYWKQFGIFIKRKYSFDKKKDIVNVQYVDFYIIFLLGFFQNNFKRIVLTFWGSDLLRQNRIKLLLLGPLFCAADTITFETDDMKKIFIQMMGKRYDSKIVLLRFGLSVIDEIVACSDTDINKFVEKYRINISKKLVVVGYNRSKQQQHVAVINSIIHSATLNSLMIIFPWNYGEKDDNYKNVIEKILKDKCDYLFIDERLNNREVAVLRCITNVLIQVQTTDSLSASMLETLYAGNHVITGSWLPYSEILNMGIKMTLVDRLDQCGAALERVVNKQIDIEEQEVNKKLIYNFSSWESNIMKWINIYRR